jgi:hypothetical protein
MPGVGRLMVALAMQDLESIVRAFIADYCQWNDRWDKRCQSGAAFSEAMAAAEAEYTELLKRYCRPGFRGQLIAFGSPSSHNPRTETVREITSDGARATVRTVNRDDRGFEADYEYSLACDNGRWFLEAVDYVNG